MHNHFINFNGQIVPEKEPVLTASNRAFHYGDGLFESVRMTSGELKFLDLHAERLQAGMKALRMSNHRQFTAEFITEQAHQLAKSNKIFDNARIRVSVFRE